MVLKLYSSIQLHDLQLFNFRGKKHTKLSFSMGKELESHQVS